MGLLVCAAFAFHNLNLLCLEARSCLCGHKAIIYVYSLFSFVSIRLFQGVRPLFDRNCLIINGFAAASMEHQIYIFYVDICVSSLRAFIVSFLRLHLSVRSHVVVFEF